MFLPRLPGFEAKSDPPSGRTFKQWKKRYFALYTYDNGPSPALYYYTSRLVGLPLEPLSASRFAIELSLRIASTGELSG